MRNGPEHQRGWRDRFEASGATVEVFARHSVRKRVPQGHEMMRSMARGRPMAMVEEPVHEWQVLVSGRRPATVRQNPNDTFAVGGLREAHPSLREAAVAYAERVAPAPSAGDEAEPEASGPAP